MKYPVEIRSKDHCAIITIDGPFSVDSYMTAFSGMVAHPDWMPLFDLIVIISTRSDFNDTNLAKLLVLRDAMRSVNPQHRSGANPRTAIVCTNELKRVIADLWLALLDTDWPIALRIFITLDEALAWLADPADGMGP